jgi:curved DNA-binding protein CbpA
MSCDCGQCREHYRTLGVGYGIPAEPEIEAAYREAVKQWHPDLYENFASLRADAEERFKLIQVAYRELKEHNTIGGEAPVERVGVQAQPGDQAQPREAEKPAISFEGAPGCLTAQEFTQEIEEMLSGHLGRIGVAVAIIDISGDRGARNDYSQFLLLATRGIMMRDVRGIISVLWSTDLGDVHLLEPRIIAKPSFWQRLAGIQPSIELQIYRSTGTQFCSISSLVDDNVKTVVYNFLLQQKPQPQS